MFSVQGCQTSGGYPPDPTPLFRVDFSVTQITARAIIWKHVTLTLYLVPRVFSFFNMFSSSLRLWQYNIDPGEILCATILVKTRVCRGCSVSRAHKTSLRSILFSICPSLLPPPYWKTRRLWGRGCDDAKPRENNRLFYLGETDSHESRFPLSTYLLAFSRLSDSRNDA